MHPLWDSPFFHEPVSGADKRDPELTSQFLKARPGQPMFFHGPGHALDAGAHLLDETAQVAKDLHDDRVAQLGLALQPLHLLYRDTGEQVARAVELDAVIEQEDTDAPTNDAVVPMDDGIDQGFAHRLPGVFPVVNPSKPITS